MTGGHDNVERARAFLHALADGVEHLRLAGLAERRTEGGTMIYDVHPA